MAQTYIKLTHQISHFCLSSMFVAINHCAVTLLSAWPVWIRYHQILSIRRILDFRKCWIRIWNPSHP